MTFFFFIGGLFATLIRIHLLTPGGYLVTPETYNKLFTMHGVAMIFFFLIPSIPAVLGNFLIPIMIGAKDLAFPEDQFVELVHLSGWRRFCAVFVLDRRPRYRLDVLYAAEQHLFEFGSHARGHWHFHQRLFLDSHRLNFIVTIHTMRAPGMTWLRLPLFVWAHYATSIIFILGTPVIAITLLLAGLESMFHLGFFNPAMAATQFCSSICSGSTRTRPCTS